MRMTLVVVAAIGLTTGACSLRSPGGAGTYSALTPEAAAYTTAAVPGQLPSGFVEVPSQRAMPGDLKGSVARQSGGGIEPVAALNASTRARSQWETLRPGELTRTPTVVPPVTTSSVGGMTAATPAAAPAAAARNGAKSDAKTYDREAAMQGLINGGRSAGKGICSGC